MNSFAQKEKSMSLGQVSDTEVSLAVYPKDSAATAIILHDFANFYVDEHENYNFRTDYYSRIKLFKKSAFDRATVTLKLHKNEKVIGIKGVSYTQSDGVTKKIFLTEDKIFTKQTSEFTKEVTFTIPNIHEGSVIEYVYSVLSPFSKIDDWYFQTDIPKVKSEYSSAIPGNWKYNIRLIGFEKLTTQETSVKHGCMYIPGIGTGSCSVIDYGMTNVPAFKEEDFMLAKKNYISRLNFDLVSFTSVDGVKTNYTKTWDHADKTLRKNFLDSPTSKKRYFGKVLPHDILSIETPLDRAKKAYQFIQDRMTWNTYYWDHDKVNIKKTYDEKTGSIAAINLVLYNALQAVSIESYLVMISTRNNGVPTKLYPVVNDFNYILVKAVIDGEVYFLDATNKYLLFGEVPLKCLNGDGRVLDFKNESYWEAITSRYKSELRTKAILAFDDIFDLSGSLQVRKTGYYALEEREVLKNKSEEDFLNDFETEHPNIEVDDFNAKGIDTSSDAVYESFEVKVDISQSNGNLVINPFIYNQFSKNPFRLKERVYPVDFGHTMSNVQLLNITLPKGYRIKKVPEKIGVSLPNKGGRYILSVTTTDHTISIYSKFQILKERYSAVEYHYLKEFFNQIINHQKNNIELEKI